MSYYHNFGAFHETIKVDGKVYSFEDFKGLPKASRLALREEAVQRCTDANRRVSAERAEVAAPVRAEFKTKREEFQARPKFQKRFAGRAAQIRRGLEALRWEERRAVEAACKVVEPVDGCNYPAAVHDVFYVWEQKVETEWERFERLVSNHDWYYAYSDDHSVWSAGNAHHSEIRALVAKLGDKAERLYNEKCPWLNEDGSLKKESA